MSGPLEELQAAMDAYDSGSWEVVSDATTDIVAAARALLAASDTGERPATWRCGRCGGSPAEHAAFDSTCIYDPILAPTPPDAGTGTPAVKGWAWVDETLRFREAMRACTESGVCNFAGKHCTLPGCPNALVPPTTGATTGDES